MGAAYRSPKAKDLEAIAAMVREVRALGLESCATLGMLTEEQAQLLKAAGLDYYNHNLDTSAEFYGEIITTRSYQDRLDTLAAVRAAGLKVCCGGILGMGESARDRAQLLVTLANLPEHPESVPINQPGAGARHAAGGCRGRRPVRLRAHDRGGAHPHAARPRAPVGRARGHER